MFKSSRRPGLRRPSKRLIPSSITFATASIHEIPFYFTDPAQAAGSFICAKPLFTRIKSMVWKHTTSCCPVRSKCWRTCIRRWLILWIFRFHASQSSLLHQFMSPCISPTWIYLKNSFRSLFRFFVDKVHKLIVIMHSMHWKCLLLNAHLWKWIACSFPGVNLKLLLVQIVLIVLLNTECRGRLSLTVYHPAHIPPDGKPEFSVGSCVHRISQHNLSNQTTGTTGK